MASKQLFIHVGSNFDMFYKYLTASVIVPGALKLAAKTL